LAPDFTYRLFAQSSPALLKKERPIDLRGQAGDIRLPDTGAREVLAPCYLPP
jgi:hypothetical protein